MLSKEFLIKRGYCCRLGCMQCPYHPKHKGQTMKGGSLQYKPLHESLTIKPSHTQGLGVFACKAIPKETDLGITHLKSKDLSYHFPQNIIRTPLGGFLNHSDNPNSYIEQEGPVWYLVTLFDIPKDTEILIKYFPNFLTF